MCDSCQHPERLLLKIPDLCQRLNLSRSTVYEMIAAKTWPIVRVGRAVRIPAAAVEAWVERRVAEEAFSEVER